MCHSPVYIHIHITYIYIYTYCVDTSLKKFTWKLNITPSGKKNNWSKPPLLGFHVCLGVCRYSSVLPSLLRQNKNCLLQTSSLFFAMDYMFELPSVNSRQGKISLNLVGELRTVFKKILWSTQLKKSDVQRYKGLFLQGGREPILINGGNGFL